MSSSGSSQAWIYIRTPDIAASSVYLSSFTSSYAVFRSHASSRFIAQSLPKQPQPVGHSTWLMKKASPSPRLHLVTEKALHQATATRRQTAQVLMDRDSERRPKAVANNALKVISDVPYHRLAIHAIIVGKTTSNVLPP